MRPARWTERRCAPRAGFKTLVTVFINDEKTTWLGCDVSETGLGITSTSRIKVEREQRVRVRFALPRSAWICSWFEADATIVRQARRKLGLRLLDLRVADRRAIRTYVFTGSAEIRDYDPAACG